jgi:hypothetical protein
VAVDRVLASNIPKERRDRTHAERFPYFDHFVNDHGREADRHPDAWRFDGQVRPRPDLQTHHRLVAVSPPAIGQSQRHFPQQADHEQKEEGETECAPIDEAPGGLEKSGRRDQRSTREIDEVPREPGGFSGEKFSINNCACDQDQAEDYGSEMKTHDARHSPGRGLIIRDVVRRHPVFVAPDITQEHEHETRQIKDELFYWYRAAARRDVDAESCGFVWEDEEIVAEQQIEDEAQRRQNCDRTPKGRARELQIGSGDEPPGQRCDRNDEEEQTPSVTERCRIVGAWLPNDGMRHGA